MKGHNWNTTCRKCGKIHTKLLPREVRICECGCGESFKCKVNSKRRFVNHHQNKGKRNPGYGKFGKLNSFSKPSIIKKIKLKHKRKIICNNCKQIFVTYQANFNNIPRICKKCIDFGGNCVVCNTVIKLGRKFCYKCKCEDTSRRMINNNPMKSEETAKKVQAKLKKLRLNGFGNLWKNKRSKMLKAIRTFQKCKSYREKISKCAVKRIQEGSNFNRKGINGWYYSKKNNRAQYFMSVYELQAFLILDKDPFVKKYEVQPMSIPYFWQGQERRYVIDLLVYKKDGTKCFVEVGAKDKLDLQKKTKIKAGQKFAKKQGCGFEVWLEKELGMTKERYNALCKAEKQKKNK